MLFEKFIFMFEYAYLPESIRVVSTDDELSEEGAISKPRVNLPSRGLAVLVPPSGDAAEFP